MRNVLPNPEAKARFVQQMFDSIATGYDAANNWMTGGLHHRWKARVIETVRLQAGQRVLDLATGTGDIAFLARDLVGHSGQVVGLDFSAEMLKVARLRDNGSTVEWVQGDMLALPFADEGFDAVTVGFGLRNVSDPQKALQEAARVIKSGGHFASLEMGHTRSSLLKPLVAGYNTHVMPWIGFVATGKHTPYRYLQQSTDAFLSQDQLAEQLVLAGFGNVRVDDLAFGTLAIVSATKS